MAKKKLRDKKPTKREKLTVAARQDFAHYDTASVARQRMLLNFEKELKETEIAGLKMELSSAQSHVKNLDAKILGLTLVMERR
jgi:hypothetical protein